MAELEGVGKTRRCSYDIDSRDQEADVGSNSHKASELLQKKILQARTQACTSTGQKTNVLYVTEWIQGYATHLVNHTLAVLERIIAW